MSNLVHNTVYYIRSRYVNELFVCLWAFHSSWLHKIGNCINVCGITCTSAVEQQNVLNSVLNTRVSVSHSKRHFVVRDWCFGERMDGVGLCQAAAVRCEKLSRWADVLSTVVDNERKLVMYCVSWRASPRPLKRPAAVLITNVLIGGYTQIQIDSQLQELGKEMTWCIHWRTVAIQKIL